MPTSGQRLPSSSFPAARRLAAGLVVLAALGCDSGLGGGNTDTVVTAPEPTPTSDSPRVGLALADGLSAALDDQVAVVAGLLGATPVSFVVFTTAAPADEVLPAPDPGGVVDGNGVSDVFVAALLPDGVVPGAFVRTLYPVTQHPRCVTCHTMNATTLASTAFVGTTGHPGGALPLNDVNGTNCAACHVTLGDFPREWKAPPDELDFRTRDQAALFEDLTQDLLPAELFEHLTNDERIDWALGDGNGKLPAVGPFNGVADDDHDGLKEPWDNDGVARTVPGGKPGFLAALNAWLDAGSPFADGDGVLADVALVSHVVGANGAGDAASGAPSVVFVPQFPPVGDIYGHLEIAFASEASDLVSNDTNGVTDVFVASFEVHFTPLGPLDEPPVLALVPVLSDPVRVSVDSGGNQATGASGAPSLGGLLGEVLAFESLAGNLVGGFADNNGAEPDVFVRQLGSGQTRLVSHGVAAADGGDGGGSFAPRVSADGLGIAFESDATDLVAGDSNGVRDVFYTLVEPSLSLDLFRASVANGGVQAAGGDSRHAGVAVLDAGTQHVRVVFESDKTDLITPSHGSTNVYLFDSALDSTTLLNQRVDLTGTTLGGVAQLAGPSLPADSFRPFLAPTGDFVLFDSLADDIDVLRPVDESSGLDAFLVDLTRFASDGFVLPFRVSVDVLGLHGNAPASGVSLAGFPDGSGVFPSGVVAFVSDASNLGAADDSRHVIAFVTESPVGSPAFMADPTSGEAPLEVTFTDASSGAIESYAWDFGDGATASDQSPTHTYVDPGTYTVSLTVAGPFGETELVRAALIEVLAPPSPAAFGSEQPAALTSTRYGSQPSVLVPVPAGTPVRLVPELAAGQSPNPTHP